MMLRTFMTSDQKISSDPNTLQQYYVLLIRNQGNISLRNYSNIFFYISYIRILQKMLLPEYLLEETSRNLDIP
jgi:hypothetical protein